MFSKRIIRIIAIVMAALMFLGVFGAAISAFATDGISSNTSIPKTGQPSSYVPMIVGGIALIAAIVCVILSKKSKKSEDEGIDSDYIKEEEVEKGLNFFTSRKEDTFIEKPEENTNEESDE